MAAWRWRILALLFFCGAPAGCVLPSAQTFKSGRMLIQKARKEKKKAEVIEAGYAYPDVNLVVCERSRARWFERLGAPVLEGRYRYSFWGDTSEIFMGPLFFTLNFGDAFFGLLVFEFHQESFENLLFLPASIPLLNHRDLSKEAEEFEDTGRIRWRPWKLKKREEIKPLPEKTVNIVAEDGTILYQAITNAEGEAYINVRDAYQALFRDGLKPARAIELVSGESCNLDLDPDRIRREALAVGDSDPADQGE